jgi:hypothetical protein
LLDPVSSIAFEMQAAKGVFALLLGSGVSRAAKIPTGWDITLDLVRAVATLQDADAGTAPETWYQTTFGKAPEYSHLLDRLASTPTLRQQVIRPYIEPNEVERARGEKLPTAAHHAIARLMQLGYVRVVLTTNFDQLLELALADLGIRPTVISTADQVSGALPLVHAGPTIVKLHGDYLDTRIRNTAGELSAYEPPLEALLDRVLDEFGLIVCGWSADWDPALRAAIDRAPSRRFPMYWVARGTPGAAAAALIERRQGRVVPIESADHFFDALGQRVQAIETLRQPHPLSADIAVTMLKEYLPEPRHQIRLHDMLTTEFDRTVERLEQPELQVVPGVWSPAIFAGQALKYCAAMDLLQPLAYAAGMWSTEEQIRPWVEVIVRLARRSVGVGGPTPLVDIRMLPATLALYAMALGALVNARPQNVGRLCGHQAGLADGTYALGDRLNISILMTDGGQDRFRAIPSYANSTLAGCDFIADVLRPLAKRELPDTEGFEAALAQLELALAFGYAERISGPRGGNWAPPGRFLRDRHGRERLIQAWRSDYQARRHECDVSRMAALRQPPRFDDIADHYNRLGFL